MKNQLKTISLSLALIAAVGLTGACKKNSPSNTSVLKEALNEYSEAIKKSESIENQKIDNKLDAYSDRETQNTALKIEIALNDQYAVTAEQAKLFVEAARKAAPEVPTDIDKELQEKIERIQTASPQEAEQFLTAATKLSAGYRNVSKKITEFNNSNRTRTRC